MKITVVIDEQLMKAAMKAAGVKTRRQAIELGLKELVRRRDLAALRAELGTYDLALDLDELKRLRGAS
ncbi:MAG: type II toxin-antitoxin system VapB family antitoxin [Actinobacteria bacterium]|nr:MAG: type II toxin-antitoxin system VapB family antitoxin [Actinomycetota bacterium]